MYVLSSFGFTVPVPRQSDFFGADFIVHLGRREDRSFVPTGPSFAIQIKSDSKPLEIKTESALRTLYETSLPFFLGVVSKESGTLSVYTTISRLRCSWTSETEKPLRLAPGGTLEQFHQLDLAGGTVYLGPPILEMEIDRLDEPENRPQLWDMFHDAMSFWAQLELHALSWKLRGVPVVGVPETYKTNEPPEDGTATRFYLGRIASPSELCKLLNSVLFDTMPLSRFLEETSRGPKKMGFSDLLPQIAGMQETVNRLRRQCAALRDEAWPSQPPGG
ncbi:MAG: hypothetical protein WBF17_02905 [Phycisphaerae bacterium]